MPVQRHGANMFYMAKFFRNIPVPKPVGQQKKRVTRRQEKKICAWTINHNLTFPPQDLHDYDGKLTIATKIESNLHLLPPTKVHG